MIINGFDLLKAAPIKDMESKKVVAHGMTYGLSEAGYDIRIKQQIRFCKKAGSSLRYALITDVNLIPERTEATAHQYADRFVLASAIEEFQMPDYLLGRVCDKSSWARKGLSVFNTVVEPGWFGFLTIELVYHGNTELVIPAGAPIAQVLFEQVKNPVTYKGRYQHQADEPTPAKEAK